MPVDMVFAHHAFEDPDILGITDLDDEFPTPLLEVAVEHVVAVLRDPHDVRCQPGDAGATMPVIFHVAALLALLKVCSN